ncbi:aminotransferase [Candidatus Velamenicoccus archaeovorus]|uniref:Aminotransferase n=1 Tax=Velamenicoccus archaeovorus TaxID=1930593 RepID=A0A410P4G5_VELA1|nr:DegT/DnrJ/EryC1/StrS family aminotransferase [Candidatus Velamenicoccus archaeovorus]QAT17010.1 aminotransferase [Candidatus Velamenicoccus archaeovorus]
MKVRFVDLAAQYRETEKEISRLNDALIQRSDYILGQDVRYFEESFASYIGCRYAIGVNSGTDALFLGLLSLGVGRGDEVIVPAYTYIASAFAVTYTGARPVFADIDEATFNIDPQTIERVITKRTKAIMPVHLYGQAADMDPIRKIARKHGLRIIEDTAQAHGAQYRGRKAGSIGDIGAFSFYPTKNLGAFGDAGLIATNSKQLYQKLKKLRDYGRISKYVHGSIGFNSRLDSVQAVFLNAKLRHLDVWNQKRIGVAEMYDKYLGDIPGIRLPRVAGYGKHVYHIYAIRVKNRDKVLEGLISAGISAAVHYPVPLHLQPVYRHLGYRRGDFPVAERVCRDVLCLPIHPHITKKQIIYVAQTLKRLVKHV